jgi:hypothetical protein
VQTLTRWNQEVEVSKQEEKTKSSALMMVFPGISELHWYMRD